jgi:hypothetical protein
MRAIGDSQNPVVEHKGLSGAAVDSVVYVACAAALDASDETSGLSGKCRARDFFAKSCPQKGSAVPFSD